MHFGPVLVYVPATVLGAQQAQRHGLADLQFTLVALQIRGEHVLQVKLEGFACDHALEVVVPAAAADKACVPVGTLELPAGLGGQAQRMGHVIGLIVERRQLAVEPLIQLRAAKAPAEQVVGLPGLFQGRFAVPQLQAQCRALLGVGL